MDLSSLSLVGVVVVLAAATAVIVPAGVRISTVSDRLADRTGLGEAVFGAVLLGAMTSLPGIVTSVAAAGAGYPELAVSNAVGGIAAQTASLGLADLAYRGVNLEHAAASIENLMQAVLVCTLLSVPLLAMSGPELHWVGVHPASLALLVAYGFGVRHIYRVRHAPSWEPHMTEETRPDEPEERSFTGRPLGLVWLEFVGLGVALGGAGFAVAQAGMELSERTGLSETVVGALFTAVSTSLPELITSVAAVRRGALTLAVGAVVGGNAFDVLFIAFADVAYRDGSIYHAISSPQVFVVALNLVMTGVLLFGMLRREKRGPANIGFESVLVLLLYFGGTAVLATSM